MVDLPKDADGDTVRVSGTPSIPTADPGSGRQGLDRRRIVGGAVSLIDTEGLKALTMRRLGDYLDVEAMAAAALALVVVNGPFAELAQADVFRDFSSDPVLTNVSDGSLKVMTDLGTAVATAPAPCTTATAVTTPARRPANATVLAAQETTAMAPATPGRWPRRTNSRIAKTPPAAPPPGSPSGRSSASSWPGPWPPGPAC